MYIYIHIYYIYILFAYKYIYIYIHVFENFKLMYKEYTCPRPVSLNCFSGAEK